MKEKFSNLISHVKATDIFAGLFAAWFAVSGVMLIAKGGNFSVSMLDSFSPLLYAAYLLCVFIFYISLYKAFSKAPIMQLMLIVSSVFFCAILLYRSPTVYALLSALVVILLVLWYVYHSGKNIFFTPPKAVRIILICIATLTGAYVIGYISVMRILTYSTYTFDFGIFSNTFYHLKTDFLPYVSCERDALMSHFAVHFSPVLYLLLPVYLIFPEPATLQIAQVIILYSGIIPLLLLLKKHHTDSLTALLVALTYSVYPAIACGCLYDFHENCFLLPFLLWLFYFFECKKTVLMFISVLLVLSVKEDAFIYVCVFAAYLIFSRKEYKKGTALLTMAILYFAAAYFYLSRYGEGIMSYRYSNLSGDGGGLFGVIKTAVMNPGYLLSQIFTANSEELGKITYFINLIFPLAFIPFLSKKFSRYILLCPILINLITQYRYQYSINFQYSFGITAFLFYLVVINLAEREEPKRRYFAAAAAISSVLMFSMLLVPQYALYRNSYEVNKDTFQKLDSVLDEIPEDSSVTASRYLTVRLTQRDEIYDLNYHNGTLTDYIVLDMRDSQREVSLKLFEKYKNDGYVLVTHEQGVVDIYKKP